MARKITTKAIPCLRRSHGVTHLIVDGKPLLLLAGELHNSSASSLAYLDGVWARVVAARCNAVSVPVSWELVEPEEGVFDFTLVDGILDGARRHGLRVIPIWFGTWKNALSTYVPAWVKTDVARFPRAQTAPGVRSHCISPLSGDACRCDARAFAALMRHLAKHDRKEQTVVMVQVENEAGLLGAARDYSPAAEAAFAGPVPIALTAYLREHRGELTTDVRASWEGAGVRAAGSWSEVFGGAAPEVFMAWHVARFTDRVAEAGKAEYALPMFVNAWLVQQTGERPGSYPSGGPVAKMMDIWRAAAPCIDALAPDIYLPDFQAVCAEYARSGNPLIIPEATKYTAAANVFPAMGTYDALCFAPFGIDSLERPEVLAESYGALAHLMPLIAAHQGTGRMIGFAQGHVIRVQSPNGPWVQQQSTPVRVELGGYHLEISFSADQAESMTPGRGLIIAVSDTEYYVVAANCIVKWGAKADDQRVPEFVSVDDGYFVDGQWRHGRRLNGDEAWGEYQQFGPALAMRRVVMHSFQ